eukprot:CAMPEP_0171364262 /NCGR_PEP_ID=MMETSP0879-20121228/3925_1 /TAXON_ID=67004 /ORGANISM="Thalassiosira weissflogii, Strain CCMP1336" /LENGTH=502 /DNA_ID=CAMNT_0011871613 /DNA_START=62 /DNA_END=1570 /DNA_ORIENTATION=-
MPPRRKRKPAPTQGTRRSQRCSTLAATVPDGTDLSTDANAYSNKNAAVDSVEDVTKAKASSAADRSKFDSPVDTRFDSKSKDEAALKAFKETLDEHTKVVMKVILHGIENATNLRDWKTLFVKCSGRIAEISGLLTEKRKEPITWKELLEAYSDSATTIEIISSLCKSSDSVSFIESQYKKFLIGRVATETLQEIESSDDEISPPPDIFPRLAHVTVPKAIEIEASSVLTGAMPMDTDRVIKLLKRLNFIERSIAFYKYNALVFQIDSAAFDHADSPDSRISPLDAVLTYLAKVTQLAKNNEDVPSIEILRDEAHNQCSTVYTFIEEKLTQWENSLLSIQQQSSLLFEEAWSCIDATVDLLKECQDGEEKKLLKSELELANLCAHLFALAREENVEEVTDLEPLHDTSCITLEANSERTARLGNKAKELLGSLKSLYQKVNRVRLLLHDDTRMMETVIGQHICFYDSLSNFSEDVNYDIAEVFIDNEGLVKRFQSKLNSLAI